VHRPVRQTHTCQFHGESSPEFVIEDEYRKGHHSRIVKGREMSAPDSAFLHPECERGIFFYRLPTR